MRGTLQTHKRNHSALAANTTGFTSHLLLWSRTNGALIGARAASTFGAPSP